MRSRTYSRCVIALAALPLLLTGCRAGTSKEETAAHSEERPWQIGLSFDSFVIERWLRDRDVFVSTAKELGAEVNVQNASGDIEEQIAQIEYFIARKMDVIAIIAIDGDALQEVVQKAKDAGIKVVCYDRLIRGVDADLYVSFDNVMVGSLMGSALKEALPDGGRIMAIYGSSSDNNVVQVQQGLSDALADSPVEIVYENYCDNWLAELAFGYVNEALDAHQDIDGVMCGNDDLASQAIRALSERRLAGLLPVVAQDAELAACQHIVEGTQTMTVYKSVADEASAAARLSVALARGEDITDPQADLCVTEKIDDGRGEIPYYRIEPVAVDKKNIDEIIIDSGFHRKEDVYLNVAVQNQTEKVSEVQE